MTVDVANIALNWYMDGDIKDESDDHVAVLANVRLHE